MSYKTEQRKILYTLLKAHPHEALSVKDIASALSDKDISVSAIYRNLAVMTEDGLVQRSIKGGSREALYQFVGCDDCRGELHLTCTECGRSFHMDHALAKSMQESIMQSDGFQIDNSKTNLYGTCKACSRK